MSCCCPQPWQCRCADMPKFLKVTIPDVPFCGITCKEYIGCGYGETVCMERYYGTEPNAMGCGWGSGDLKGQAPCFDCGWGLAGFCRQTEDCFDPDCRYVGCSKCLALGCNASAQAAWVLSFTIGTPCGGCIFCAQNVCPLRWYKFGGMSPVGSYRRMCIDGQPTNCQPIQGGCICIKPPGGGDCGDVNTICHLPSTIGVSVGCPNNQAGAITPIVGGLSIAEPEVEMESESVAAQSIQWANGVDLSALRNRKRIVARNVIAALEPKKPRPQRTRAKKDCGCSAQSVPNEPQNIILHLPLSPGDSLVLSQAIRSIHLAYPNQYKIGVDCTAGTQLYQNNPDITWGLKKEESNYLRVHYPAINESNKNKKTFAQGICDYIGEQLGIRIPLAVDAPILVLSDQEKAEAPSFKQPYCLINCGGKQDYTAKIFGSSIAQEVVDYFKDRITFVQVGEAHHLHKKLNNVVDMVGKTTIRDLIRLAYHSEFGVGAVSLNQWIYAAFSKPYVAVHGGREPLVWNSAPNKITLHTIGELDCCETGGCWKSRTVALNDGDDKDKSLCKYPVEYNGEVIPKCHAMIGSQGIIQAIEQQVLGGK